MDLNLQALIGLTYVAPIAITLRKIYSPDFDMPDAFVRVLAKLDTSRMDPRFVNHFMVAPTAQHATLG